MDDGHIVKFSTNNVNRGYVFVDTLIPFGIAPIRLLLFFRVQKLQQVVDSGFPPGRPRSVSIYEVP